MKISRGLALVGLAAMPACILFGVDDLTGGIDAGGVDATSDDVTTIDDSSLGDASALDTGAGDAQAEAAFDCRSIDATFCDSFDRDATIAVGAPWTSTDTRSGCTIAVDGELTTTFDASSGSQDCFLVSNPTSTKNRDFTLDFDVSYATDTSSASLIMLAQLGVSFTGVDDSGVALQTFQLFASGTGSGRVGMFDYFPDAAASPMRGNQYVAYTLGNATPFVHGSPPCHITWTIDAVTPSASATSNCDGILSTTISSSTKPPNGFIGTATLELGYANGGVVAPAWSISYDNMVFRASP